MSDKNVKLKAFDNEREVIHKMYLECIKPWLKPSKPCKIEYFAEQIKMCELEDYMWLSLEEE